MASQHIVHINEADFHSQVLQHSTQQPVVVDFWAEWCIPCRGLDRILEHLAEEAGGAFRLAKLDVDANPRLAAQLGVKNIPAVKAFRNGQLVAEFNGIQPEAKVREFLQALGPTTYDLEAGRAEHLLAQEDWAAAEEAFRLILDNNPDHPAGLLGLAKSLLAQGDFAGALPILRNFPVSKLYGQAEQLIPLAQAMADDANSSLAEDELSALFANSLRLVGRGQLEAALDGLLELLRQDKRYAKGLAHRCALGILNLLGEQSPKAQTYRKELASLLF
ncbi:MAG: tetratricopeptide repeat protein [Anaerolineales bacterium]|nr:MAG: tetratricopeptide repeat protein [Anaerolineales bacterium]